MASQSLFRALPPICLLLGLLLATAVARAGYNEGLAAYRKGEVALALKEFMPQAQAGNAASQIMVAQILINGGKGVAKNPREAMVWVRRAAEGNNRDAQFFLAQALYNGHHGEQKDLTGAAKWFERAAIAGDRRAMQTFAQMQVFGVGVARNPRAAIPALETLAASDDVLALALLGQIHVQPASEGATPDYATAARYLAKASEMGDPGSAFLLGQLHTKGFGVVKNPIEGVRLIRLAADSGNYSAMLFLGGLLANGADDVRPDIKEAYKWITIVLNRAPPGDVFYNASGIETQLRPRLSSSQIEAAQAEASRFVATPMPRPAKAP